jgi:hypothetical protein
MGGTMERTACCQCGGLRAIVSGEPLEVGVCHCTGCQRRTGSAFGVEPISQNRKFALREHIRSLGVEADNGRFVTNSFCPTCGSTIYWELDILPEGCGIAVALLLTRASPHRRSPGGTGPLTLGPNCLTSAGLSKHSSSAQPHSRVHEANASGPCLGIMGGDVRLGSNPAIPPACRLVGNPP